MSPSIHENFSRDDRVLAGSDRLFGLTMAAVLGLLALINWWHDGQLWPWVGGSSFLFVAAAVLCPVILNPLNQIWFKFGLFLHKVVNPIVMGVVFYGAVLPTGLVMRMLGNDLLRLKLEPEARSYWIVRQPPGPAPESMKDQF